MQHLQLPGEREGTAGEGAPGLGTVRGVGCTGVAGWGFRV